MVHTFLAEWGDKIWTDATEKAALFEGHCLLQRLRALATAGRIPWEAQPYIAAHIEAITKTLVVENNDLRLALLNIANLIHERWPSSPDVAVLADSRLRKAILDEIHNGR